MNEALIVLSSLGLLISTYFTCISFGWCRHDSAWMPRFCRMEKETCGAIVFTWRARLFGIPNSLLGQFYYLGIITGVLLGRFSHDSFLQMFLVASAITVLVAIYLTYSLFIVIRVRCHLCLASHGINTIIFLLFLGPWEHWA